MIRNKLYFFSDFHLGMPSGEISRKRERLIVSTLKSISIDAHSVFLLGDIFDFWFEYKQAVPKGFFRLLTTLSEMTDSGISVFLFPGNHDLWYHDYLIKECGVQVIKEPSEFYFKGKKFHVHHGDGLGPGDIKYKAIKKLFLSKVCVFIFRWLHPDIGISLARYLSSKSRLSQKEQKVYLGDEREYLTQYCRYIIKEKNNYTSTANKDSDFYFVQNDQDGVNYFVFGHRHLLLNINLSSNAKYINLGHWLKSPHYGVFDGLNFSLIEVVAQEK